jgi:hypothetical protein
MLSLNINPLKKFIMNLKELVKRHFNLVDANATVAAVEFATAKTLDGQLTLKFDELSAGKEIFLVDNEGNEVKAPTGEYVLEDKKVVKVEDGIIAEVKEATDVEVEVEAEDVVEEEVVEEMKDKEEKMAELTPALVEELIKQIAAVVEEKLQPLEARLAEVEDKSTKMAVAPAAEPTVIKSNKNAEIFKGSALTKNAEARLNRIANELKTNR